MGCLGVDIKLAIAAVIMMLLTQTLGNHVNLLENRDNKATPDNDIVGGLHSPLYGRVLFSVLSLILTCALSALFATRVKCLRHVAIDKLNPSRILTLLSYPIAILFVFAASLFVEERRYSAGRICYASVVCCLAFYVLSKMVLYLFLLERGVTLNNKPRHKDPYYIVGIVIIVFGFGAIAITCFFSPIAEDSARSGICRIGPRKPALISLLGYDVFINIALTTLYLVLGNKIAKNLSWAAIGKVIAGAMPFRNYGELPGQADTLQHMMAKSIIGSVLIVVGTAANLTLMIVLSEHEDFWLCMLLCCLDTTWSVIIIHWLTSNPFLDHGDRPTALHSKAQDSPGRRARNREYEQMPREREREFGPNFRIE